MNDLPPLRTTSFHSYTELQKEVWLLENFWSSSWDEEYLQWLASVEEWRRTTNRLSKNGYGYPILLLFRWTNKVSTGGDVLLVFSSFSAGTIVWILLVNHPCVLLQPPCLPVNSEPQISWFLSRCFEADQPPASHIRIHSIWVVVSDTSTIFGAPVVMWMLVYKPNEYNSLIGIIGIIVIEVMWPPT